MKKQHKVADIVLVPFPFSDLSKNKVRPALLLAHDKEDYTLVFITSLKPKGSLYIEVIPNKNNNLKMISFVRYTKLASLDSAIVIGKIGSFLQKDFDVVKQKIKQYLEL